MSIPYKKKPNHNSFKAQMSENRPDMQGLIVRGYDSLNASQFIPLRITHALKAQMWLKKLARHFITPATKPDSSPFPNGDPEHAVHVAFTYSGLVALGLPEEISKTFSRPFIEGMAYSYRDPNDPTATIRERSTILGDTGRNDPKHWYWGNKEKQEKQVDLILLIYSENREKLTALVSAIHSQIEGVAVVHRLDNYEYHPDKLSREHFGFGDGLSQPIIKGFSKAEGVDAENKLFNPGEFILGYLNEYGHYSPSPLVPAKSGVVDLPLAAGLPDKYDLGKNGTYLVFRQMEQHVETFWDYLYRHSKEDGVTKEDKAIRLGAKMVGRWPDGQPLVTCPLAPGVRDPNTLNDFNFARQDENGLHCPLGAHIRRTNPRDQVHTGRDRSDSLEMSRKHRMLRRGRIYGSPLKPDMNITEILSHIREGKFSAAAPADGQTPIVRGLHFICLVSDIERQFEFVQNVWANTPTFADLFNEVDPLIAPRSGAGQQHSASFSTPQKTIRKKYHDIPQFTTVIGGAYFFMPGIRALDYILSQTIKYANKPVA